MLCKRRLMHLPVKEAICLSIFFVILSSVPAWGQYSSLDCTGPQVDCSQLLPLCDDGTYPDCVGGCQFTPIDPDNPHTFIVDERPAGVPNDPHFIFTDHLFSPGCWDYINSEGELKAFDPNAFPCWPFGDNDIFVFATEGLVDPLPPPDPCGDCSNPPLMRGCPTQYGWFFDIDSDRDGSYDDMEVAFLDAGRAPLNFRLLFVPLNWTGNQADFDQAAQDQVTLFANSTTLGGCMDTIVGVTLDVATQSFNTFTCNNTNCFISTIRDFLRDNEIFSYEYDVVVGLLPAGGSPCPPAAGCSNGINTLWIDENNDPILAHEIGHIYSLEDEYCSEESGGDPRCAAAGDLNPLDAALNCDPNTGMGCCACPNAAAPAGSDACSLACDPAGVDNYFNCCAGNDGALGGGSRCIMAAAGSGAGLQNWCQHCLDRLNGQTEFACDNIPSNPFEDVLAIELEISQDGTVQFHGVELGRGRPTRTDIPGSRFQVLLDTAEGNLLNESFDFLNWGSSGGGEIDQESVDFYYKVPVDFPINDPPQMTLTVLDGGVISFRGTLFGTPPVADAGDDIQEECESPLGNSVTLDGTGSSDADGDTLSYDWSASGITFDDATSVTPTGQFPIGQTEVTLVVSDGVFDSSPDTVSVEIVDLTGPSIMCPGDTTIECDEVTNPSNTGTATAIDTCDLSPAITYSDMTTPGECSDEYVITRTWRATDAHGQYNTCTQVINVVDTTLPDINCPAEITIECDEITDPSNTGNATATDNCDAAPAVNFSDVTAPGDCPEESIIKRTWTAEDECDNVASCDQIITVADTTPPVISCNAPATITPPDAPISFAATASDNCDEEPAVEITGYDCYMETNKGKRIDKTESCVVSYSGDTVNILDSGGVKDNITWTVRATDCSGNSSELVCHVLVVNPAK